MCSKWPTWRCRHTCKRRAKLSMTQTFVYGDCPDPAVIAVNGGLGHILNHTPPPPPTHTHTHTQHTHTHTHIMSPTDPLLHGWQRSWRKASAGRALLKDNASHSVQGAGRQRVSQCTGSRKTTRLTVHILRSGSRSTPSIWPPSVSTSKPRSVTTLPANSSTLSPTSSWATPQSLSFLLTFLFLNFQKHFVSFSLTRSRPSAAN